MKGPPCLVLEDLVQIRLPAKTGEDMHKHHCLNVQSSMLLGQSLCCILPMAFIGASGRLQNEGRKVCVKQNHCWIACRGISSAALEEGESISPLRLPGSPSLLHECCFRGLCRRQVRSKGAQDWCQRFRGPPALLPHGDCMCIVELVQLLNLVVFQRRETRLQHLQARRDELQMLDQALPGVVNLAACIAHVINCIELHHTAVSMYPPCMGRQGFPTGKRSGARVTSPSLGLGDLRHRQHSAPFDKSTVKLLLP